MPENKQHILQHREVFSLTNRWSLNVDILYQHTGCKLLDVTLYHIYLHVIGN